MRRIYRGKRGAGEIRGRKTLRRAGIVLAFGALLSAGMLASGALGMVSIVTGTTDSSSTATDTTTAPTDSTSTVPSDSGSTSTDTTPTSTGATTTTETTTTTTTTSSPFSPSITSDQEDYNPGATVILTGTGWGVGEAVHVTVNDDKEQPWSYSTDTSADTTGGFTVQFSLPTSFAASYSVTATGASGAVATTTFTDGRSVTS